MTSRRFIDVDSGAIEYELHAGDPSLAPLVFLHEGLGSIDLWRGVPDDLRAETGDRTTLVFARHGYGKSAPAVLPRPTTYMHHEAHTVLPQLLGALGLSDPVLIGHSDGASIALLYAGAANPVTALVCIAPHVFVEAESIAGIERARDVFESSDMPERLGRYHEDPVATFRGWNDVWLSDDFRVWNIEDHLPAIKAPVMLVQGGDDQYGTIAQIEAIERDVGGTVERRLVAGAGHSPHLDASDEVVRAMADFIGRG